MVHQKPVILIVEDDLDVSEMLDAYFRVQGYDVLIANWGLEGVEKCHEEQPDLVILDIRLPDIDGYEVAKRLRENRKTINIPIIFLTEKRNRSDRLQGLELGADDYITKPFDIQELRLRVRNALQRSALGSISNPVTGLPEGAIVDKRLTDCLKNDSWAMLLITLENLEIFREAYGFVACDDVLRAVSLMIQSATRKFGNIDDFIGQFSSSALILVTSPESITKLKEQIGSRLGQSLDYFYPLRDRELPIQKDKRLAVKIVSLLPSQGPFRNLEDIKSTLVPKD
ncbi:MAG: response regulator [Anaerolineales bacterium]